MGISFGFGMISGQHDLVECYTCCTKIQFIFFKTP